MNPLRFKQAMDYLTRIKKVKPDLPDVFPASQAPIPPKKESIETMEAINRFVRDNPRQQKAGGGMLVQPGFGGTRQAYGAAKGSGIKLSAEQIKKLEENLSSEEFKKLDFDRTGVKADQVNYGIGQRDDKRLFRKVVNILKPGAQSTGSKILVNEKLSNALIKSANAGDDIQTIIKKMNKLDKSLSRNQISSAINALVARGKIKEEFGRAPFTKISVGEKQAYTKIIEKEVNAGKLNRAQIARKAGVTDGTVQDWIVNNKGQKFYDENYTYEKGRLKTGTLQKQKDLFNYIETVDNISAQEVKKIFKMKSGKETQELMSDLISVIYRMRGNTKTGSIIVPYDDEGRMREVLRKIRNAPDFEDIYQRRIGDLIRDAYPKGPKRVQALKSLGQYWEFSRALKEVAPELALNLDHVVPFGFLEEVKQGQNPINLIKVKPIPAAVNRFKANFDSARINLNRELRLNPTDKNTLKKFKILKELEQITPIDFGGISAKGNIYDFKTKPIGQSNLIEDAIEGLKTYNRVGKFSKQVLEDESLQKKFLEAGVDVGRDFSVFKTIKPLPKATQDKIINTIVSYSKLKKCQISLNAEGGRIGFANSIECIQDGLNEQKIAAQRGNKKAARELVKVSKIAARGSLLKNVLGPGALLGEAVYEGAVIGNKVLGGTPADIAYAESYLSYLDPRKYRGELDPTTLKREDMLTREIEDEEGNVIKKITAPGNIPALRSGFAAQDQLSAFNQAIEDRDTAKARGRIDQYIPAAAEAREQGRLADQSADIISSEAFKDASQVAQEYLQGQAGKQQAGFGAAAVPQSVMADETRRLQAMREMKNLYPQYSDEEILDILKQSNLDPKDYDYTFTPKTVEDKPLFPAAMGVKPLTGFDAVRDFLRQQDQMQAIADAGGVANLAGGGIAKLAGVDSGPPPSSGPNSQGLQGLMKRVKRI